MELPAEDEDWTCPLCLKLLHLPTSTNCGHSFCKPCLAKSVEHGHTKCPTCRAALPYLGADDMSINVTLSKMLCVAFPAATAQRKAEEEEAVVAAAAAATDGAGAPDGAAANGAGGGAPAGAASNALPRLGLFVLDALLPRQKMVLHVFEPRYRLLVQRALQGGRRFGMVSPYQPGFSGSSTFRGLGDVPGPSSRRFGVEVEIEDCTRSVDGRYMVRIVGRRPFRLVSQQADDAGYYMASVEWIVPGRRPLAGWEGEENKAEDEALQEDEGSSMGGVGGQGAARPRGPGRRHGSGDGGDAGGVGGGDGDAVRDGVRGGDRGDVEAFATTEAAVEASEVKEGTEGKEENEGKEGKERKEADPRQRSPDGPATISADTAETSTPTPPPRENSNPPAAGLGAERVTAQTLELASQVPAVVRRWEAMVREGGWESFPGHLAEVRDQLGPLPPANDMGGSVRLALWVAALINPLPGLGVAPEIRLTVLQQLESPVELQRTVLRGLDKSIRYLTPSPTMIRIRRFFRWLLALLGVPAFGPSVLHVGVILPVAVLLGISAGFAQFLLPPAAGSNLTSLAAMDAASAPVAAIAAAVALPNSSVVP